MSRQYYVRDRGRVIGPFSSDQLFDMRDRGQIQAYHEISMDQKSWKAFDLMFPSKSAPDRPTAPPPPRTRPDSGGRAREPAGSGSNRTFMIVVGSAVAALLVIVVTIGIVYYRLKSKSDADNGGGTTPAGAITFTTEQPEEQDRVFRDTVGLVVAGLEVVDREGKNREVPAFSIDNQGGRSVVRFGYATDLIEDKFGENFLRLSPGEQQARWAKSPAFDLTDFGTGSGFVVSPTGHFITNQHVVKEIHQFGQSQNLKDMAKALGATIEPRVWVFFGREKKCVAKILHVSKEYDMAVLHLDRPFTHYYALCDTPPLDIPSTLKNLSALGFPGEDRKDLTAKDRAGALLRKGVTEGPVERLFMERAFEFSNRDGSVTQRAHKNQMDENQRECYVLQTSAQIYGGNSGGPLVAKDGTVIGINTWSKKNAVGISYALTLPQLHEEIGAHVPGAVWRKLPK